MIVFCLSFLGWTFVVGYWILDIRFYPLNSREDQLFRVPAIVKSVNWILVSQLSHF